MTDEDSSTKSRLKNGLQNTKAESTGYEEANDPARRGDPPHEGGGQVRMRRTRMMVTNTDTGETEIVDCVDPSQLMMSIRGTARALDRAFVNAGKEKREFAMVVQKAYKDSAKADKLSDADSRIFAYCVSDMKYGNEIASTQVEIANDLGKSQTAVNRAFKRFREMGMIERSRMVKGTPVYRINEEYAIKGKRELNGTSEMSNVIRADFTNKRRAS